MGVPSHFHRMTPSAKMAMGMAALSRIFMRRVEVSGSNKDFPTTDVRGWKLQPVG